MSDVVDDSIFHFVLSIWFRRRGEKKVKSVEKLLESFLIGHGELTLRETIITADRGYGKDDFAHVFSEKGFGIHLFIPYLSVRIHPYIAALYFLRGGG